MIFTRTKGPNDTQDYDFNYTLWLSSLSDTGASSSVTASTGITLQSSSLSNGIIKVWLSGGTDGQTYTITAQITTTGGRIRQDILLLSISTRKRGQMFPFYSLEGA